MTTPSALERPTGVPLGRRLAARLVLLPAVVLALLPPRRIRAVLSLLRRGAAPAT
ncbi:polyketide beta-ketoacyl synthase, partial [Streptomyces sp. SID7804]|nr:polyketide beta-ketoacyl synthase [Streptomyces sp. SID7804]